MEQDGDVPRGHRAAPAAAWAGLAALWTYLSLVLLLGTSLVGVTVRVRHWLILSMAVYVTIAICVRWARRARILTDEAAATLALATLSPVAALLAADVAFAVSENVRGSPSGDVVVDYERESDANVWYGEVLPSRHYPTDRGFFRYKPNVAVNAASFGGMYSRYMLDSPTLVDSVLSSRSVSVSIDENGFRESNAMDQTRIFALGDSFTFGYSVADGFTWVDRLEQMIGAPIYNLGVSNTGPKQQLMLLEALIEQYGADLPIEHVLWMIFEGNDLEDDYGDLRGTPDVDRVIDGTLLDLLVRVPGRVRNESIIQKLLSGRITLGRVVRGLTTVQDPYEVDGVRLHVPLYHSAQWGYQLFLPADIEAAQRPRSYVTNHAHAPQLARVFRRMGAVSDSIGFRVTVVLAPSAPRVFGSDFEGFPEMSEEPYFLDFVDSLSQSVGFDVVDLLPMTDSEALRERLYYPDDNHWSEVGNDVVARLLSTAIQF